MTNIAAPDAYSIILDTQKLKWSPKQRIFFGRFYDFGWEDWPYISGMSEISFVLKSQWTGAMVSVVEYQAVNQKFGTGRLLERRFKPVNFTYRFKVFIYNH